MHELWKKVAIGALAITVSIVGAFYVMASDHGERIARVETAIIYLKDLVKHNEEHNSMFHGGREEQ